MTAKKTRMDSFVILLSKNRFVESCVRVQSLNKIHTNTTNRLFDDTTSLPVIRCN